MQIQLGENLKDRVTDFVGIAISKTEYLNGCIQYQLVSKKTKEKEATELIVDIEQLEKIDNGILKHKKVTHTGGPKNYQAKVISKQR